MLPKEEMQKLRYITDISSAERTIIANMDKFQEAVCDREILMNACMHRNFHSNMPIRFYRYLDRIEVMNAGGLYGKARPENFPEVNDYRNPIQC